MRSIFLVAMVIACVALLSQAADHVLATDPSVSGSWAAPISWPEVAVHGVMLNNGKVLTWQDGSKISVWDPATNSFSTVAGTGSNIFCAGHVTLPDGRVGRALQIRQPLRIEDAPSVEGRVSKRLVTVRSPVTSQADTGISSIRLPTR